MACLSTLITENLASADYAGDSVREWRFQGLERVQPHNKDIRLVIKLRRTYVFLPLLSLGGPEGAICEPMVR